MHSTVWLSTELHYTSRSIQKQIVHIFSKHVYFTYKIPDKHISPDLGILHDEVKQFIKWYLHENSSSSGFLN